jgi:hypothetical protein
MYKDFESDDGFAAYRDYLAQRGPDYDADVQKDADARFQLVEDAASLYGTPTDQQWIGRAFPFPELELYKADYKVPPAQIPPLGITDTFTYFERVDLFRYPGLFYLYWREQHPDAEPLPFSNSIRKPSFRSITGVSFANLLTDGIMGPEDFDANGYFAVGRNYRDFEELYEWVDLPLKQYAWDELAPYPRLVSAFDKVQKAYLSVIEQSPLRATASAAVFRGLKSWSPENRAALEGLLSPSPSSTKQVMLPERARIPTTEGSPSPRGR